MKKGFRAAGCPPVDTCPCCGLAIGSWTRTGKLSAKLLRCPRCNTPLAHPAGCPGCGFHCAKEGQ